MYIKINLILLVLFSAIGSASGQKKYTLLSPDHSIQLLVSVNDRITYGVLVDNKEIVQPSVISFRTDRHKEGWKVSGKRQTNVQEVLHPVVWQRSGAIANNYNELRLDFKNGLSVAWRAYDNGIAWHWLTTTKGAYKVLDEQAAFSFDRNGVSWYPQEDDFFSHNERQYKNYMLDSIDEKKLASLPALFGIGSIKVLLTESNLFNYAGMWLRGEGGGKLKAVFPHYPKEKKITSDRDEQVVSREEYIATGNGARSYPWRILMIARNDKDLLNNQLVYQLAQPAEGDYSWVKPGKVQWDWWHYNNIYEVDFRAGINNDTYKYYIDFAARNGIEYVLLDEGWCDTRDLMKQSPGIDVEELVRYAGNKGVDLLLWTSWLVLDRQLDTALNVFARWGIKGIKVDFMQRDDQQMVNYYERVAKSAASRKMLVDFHGAYKPTGWLRSLPNVLTSEGVLGNEISKFAPLIDPDHTTTLPFTRMMAGPMDFTPGGMLNVQKDAWSAHPAEPMTLGTRCNQLAMYVVYESPLQMLCDMPTHYYKEPETMAFLKQVPTEWKTTVPLEAKVGDYVVMAREGRNGNWYIGAMTDWTQRDFTIHLGFLSEGNYTMYIWKDGSNAGRNAKDFAFETQKVTKDTAITISMAPGGGYVARIVKD